jgi:hypothetical protein
LRFDHCPSELGREIRLLLPVTTLPPSSEDAAFISAPDMSTLAEKAF